MAPTKVPSRKWTREEATLLLELSQSFPALWIVKSSDYMNRNVKVKYLEKIQKGLSTINPSITIENIKDKIHKMRVQYQKERVKVKLHSKSGEVYKPTLWLYEKMSFLDAVNCNVCMKNSFKRKYTIEFKIYKSNKRSKLSRRIPTCLKMFEFYL